MKPEIVEGDLLSQKVEVIINAWNRNIILWWLLLPQGVSGAIKKKGGYNPFKELAKHGPMALGEAVFTGPGCLNFKAIIHVSGINMFWQATEFSIRSSVTSAMSLVNDEKFNSVAFQLIGAVSVSFSRDKALAIMLDAFSTIKSSSRVLIVKFKPI